MTIDNLQHRLSVRRVFALILATIALPLILDQVVFRGVYLWFLEPESTAGLTLLARSVQSANYVPGKKNVLILGDSRIGEGFSARIANEIGTPHGFNFIGLGLPGTSPRVWHYVLRDLDPQRINYHAIFMMAATLRDDDTYEDFLNRSIDTAYIAPLFDWTDILSYPQSFSDPKAAQSATNAVAFPSATYKSDVLGFVKAPIKRVKKVYQWRTDYPSWLTAYPGRTEKLPPVKAPFASNRVLAQLNGSSKSALEEYFQLYQNAKPQPAEHMFAYRSKWFGQIAQQYAATAVSVGVFLIPRGPYHAALNKPAEADGSLKLMERKGGIRLVDTSVSLPLEVPEFFFDHLHMNAEGRKAFSQNLAEAIITQLKQ